MTDRFTIGSIAADCERYWRAAGIARRTASDMRTELEQHLADASLAGRTPEQVVGPDVAAFAVEWAEAQSTTGNLPEWESVFSRRRHRPRWADFTVAAVVVVTVAGAVLATRGEGDGMENEAWRWFWVIAAVVLSVGEMFTAGFFMLPIGIGAAAAAVLAFTGTAVPVQLAVFVVVSAAALWFLQRFARRGDENQPAVGANRFVGMTATVLEDIDRAAAIGRVRMETELWRATTDGGPIRAGTEVRIVDVRGTRLVVEPID